MCNMTIETMVTITQTKTIRGHLIKESEFGYIVNLDSDSRGKSNTTVT